MKGNVPVEYLDIVTSTGMPTGKRVSRNEVHRTGLWHKTVHVWVMNTEMDILLQKRSQLKESYPGLWDISCAGHISSGESSLDAAIKELEEELGIVADETKLQLLFSQSTQVTHHGGLYIDNEIYDTYLFLEPVSIENIRIHPDEVERVQYVSFRTFFDGICKNSNDFVPREDECREMKHRYERGLINL